MTSRIRPAMRATLVRLPLALGLVILIGVPSVPRVDNAGAAESATSSQCVACHTDAAKLKALTPPDPPAAETGEG